MTIAETIADTIAKSRESLEADPQAALAQARVLLARFPGLPEAQLLAAAALRRLDRRDEAVKLEDEAIAAAIALPAIGQAGEALGAGKLGDALRTLRDHLTARPDEPVGLRLLAEVAVRSGVPHEAEAGLRRAVRIAPSFTDARLALADLLLQSRRSDEAIALYEETLADQPDSVEIAIITAMAHVRVGRHDRAAAIYAAAIERTPDQALLHLGLGYALKTLGRTDEAVAAYRAATAITPEFGEVWWALADLKNGALGEADRDRMLEQLARPEIDRQGTLPADLRRAHRIHLHFALGHAYESAGEAERAWVHYDEANHLVSTMRTFDPDALDAAVDRSIAFFTPALFASRAGQGCQSPDPIFIVGLPRSGSTLVEQILASHPDVEGTSELPYIPHLVERLLVETLDNDWPDLLGSLPADRLRALGEEYLAAARPHRHEGKSFFIDKLPNNWHETGFIRLILPNARIVDVRRNPLDCGVSNFKQHYAQGQAFSNGLAEIGRYYRAYLKLMRHFDAVQPDAVHTVIYDDLVADPEPQIRALLSALGLGWDPAVLAPHANTRAVRSASAEQVRRPISAAGVGDWRRFERWLKPLRDTLGDAETDWAR